ncbi:unnamed protein product [Effrenium voratum]|nr:unnamed protein product [Effrenium voratum]
MLHSASRRPSVARERPSKEKLGPGGPGGPGVASPAKIESRPLSAQRPSLTSEGHPALCLRQSRPQSAPGRRPSSSSSALDLQQGRWRPRARPEGTPSVRASAGRLSLPVLLSVDTARVKNQKKRKSKESQEPHVLEQPAEEPEARGTDTGLAEAQEILELLMEAEDAAEEAEEAEEAESLWKERRVHLAPDARNAPAVPVLDEQQHKSLATVWSSVWLRKNKCNKSLKSLKSLKGEGYLDGAWAEGSKGVLARLSCKMAPKAGRWKHPGKALQMVVASNGLVPVWLPESADEDELNESLDPVTGTIFKHWCHARESEIRVDDLPMILADFGIEANQDCLDQALAGNIYATLDWPDFVSVLKDYRRLERAAHAKILRGVAPAEDVERLLCKLGQPAALQAFDESQKNGRKDRTKNMDLADFEDLLCQLRLNEGFSQSDLRELNAFFEVEKTSEHRKEPVDRCSLDKVQQVMMLRGFPTTQEEVNRMAEKLGADGVNFRQMLRLIRCLKDLERTQMLEIIQTYSAERRNAIEVTDLPLALGGLGYYPDEDAINEHLEAIGARECVSLTPEELALFLQKYRQASGFTREQYKNLGQSFMSADKTKRGQLNALELTEVLRRAGFHVTMQDVLQALFHFDLEGNGLLSLPEALTLVRGLLAKEAETRRNAFLAACRAQKLPARDLAATMARVRGYQPDKTVLGGMLKLLGLHSMGLCFTSFEHVCKLMRGSDTKFMQSHSGYTPEQVAELKVHFKTYDPDDKGFVAGAKLPQLFLDAFPTYSTCSRKQTITKQYIEEVNEKWAGSWTFEAFLGFVRMAEDEVRILAVCRQDLDEEEQLVKEMGLSTDERRGFRDVFVRKAYHNCAVSSDDILDMFDFAAADFSQEQRCRFQHILEELDRHYYGRALRFPDFLRLMKRLTEKQTEEHLGVVRASLRLKRQEDEAEAWERLRRAPRRGMSRAGSLFFKTELDIQRIKSSSETKSEK